MLGTAGGFLANPRFCQVTEMPLAFNLQVKNTSPGKKCNPVSLASLQVEFRVPSSGSVASEFRTLSVSLQKVGWWVGGLPSSWGLP